MATRSARRFPLVVRQVPLRFKTCRIAPDTGVMFDIDDALKRLIERDGSDLHVKVPSPPIIRVHGELHPLEEMGELTPDDTERALRQILSEPALLEEFDRDGEVDFAYSIPGVSRFRVNAFRQRGSVSIACRAIPYQVRSISELGLPPVITKLAE